MHHSPTTPFNFVERLRHYEPDQPLTDVPAGPGIFILYDEAGHLRRLVTTQDLRARASYYFHEREAAESLSVARRAAASMDWLTTRSRFETNYAHFLLFRHFFPASYQTLYSLPAPYFLCVTEEAYPQLLVTRTLREDARLLIGPFAWRQTVTEQIDLVNSLLSLRRCDYLIVPHQPYERCLYLQMGSCAAPCDDYAQPAYMARVDDAVALLSGDATPVLAAWMAQRDTSSAALNFEEAMRWQGNIQRLETWLGTRPRFLRGLAALNFVVPQRTKAGLDLFWVREGTLADWARLADPSTEAIEAQLAEWHALPFERPPWPVMRDDLAFITRWLWSREPTPYEFVDDMEEGAARLLAHMADEVDELTEEGAVTELPEGEGP